MYIYKFLLLLLFKLLSSVMVPRKCLVSWMCSVSSNHGKCNADKNVLCAQAAEQTLNALDNQKFLASEVLRLLPAVQMCTLKIP